MRFIVASPVSAKRRVFRINRFHDLRHVNASVMLEAKIPDKYSTKRMGHATPNMLNTTYQHIFREDERLYDDVIEEGLEAILHPDK